MVCRSAGSIARIFSTSSRNPRSSIRSASSSTSARTRSSRSWRPLARSSRRPGVPTTISTPRFSASVCGSYATPPYTGSTRTPRVRPAASMSRATCKPSSRVGTTTSAWGSPSAPSAGASTRCSSGTPNPSVLPVPVGACPIRSAPRSAMGSAYSWIANVRSMPTACSAATVSGRTPMSAKVGLSGRTGARAASSVATASVSSMCVKLSGCPSRGSAPALSGCARMYGAGRRRQFIAGHTQHRRGSQEHARRRQLPDSTGKCGPLTNRGGL